MNKDLIKCPKCGSMAKTYLYSTATLLYIPQEYDSEGNLIESGVTNKVVTKCKCKECGEIYDGQ